MGEDMPVIPVDEEQGIMAETLRRHEPGRKLGASHDESLNEEVPSEMATGSSVVEKESPQPAAADDGNISPVAVEVAFVEMRTEETRADSLGGSAQKAQKSEKSEFRSIGSEDGAAKLALQRAVKKEMMLINAAAKVPMQNKIGTKLEGWYRDVALALQQGIAEHGRRSLTPHTEAPAIECYAPASELFRRARVACGFTPARYYATMGLQEGLNEPSLALVGSSAAAGKSGAFFFLSPDQQLIAKSCTDEDWRTLLQILDRYVGFMESARQRADDRIKSGSLSTDTSIRGFVETLLPRYLGLYRITVGKDPKPVHVVVMANIFSGALSIDRRYDLKGSTHGRKSSQKERAKKTPVLKDLDWCADETSLAISAAGRSTLLETIRSDAEFLATLGLMDYSLLVGVHEINKEPVLPEVMNIVSVRDSTRHCYLGIIDVLTPYRLRKRAETLFMGRLLCGRDISCQHPQVYAKRFYNFVETRVFAPV